MYRQKVYSLNGKSPELAKKLARGTGTNITLSALNASLKVTLMRGYAACTAAVLAE